MMDCRPLCKKQIQTLDVSDNAIGFEGLTAILKSCNNLEDVRSVGCDMSSDEFAKFGVGLERNETVSRSEGETRKCS